jgi:hypothetical protein
MIPGTSRSPVAMAVHMAAAFSPHNLGLDVGRWRRCIRHSQAQSKNAHAHIHSPMPSAGPDPDSPRKFCPFATLAGTLPSVVFDFLFLFVFVDSQFLLPFIDTVVQSHPQLQARLQSLCRLPLRRDERSGTPPFPAPVLVVLLSTCILHFLVPLPRLDTDVTCI